MKVLLAFVVAVASVSALGSGPYLPSGWRPSGPAFFLPTEVKETTPAVKNFEATQPTPQSSVDSSEPVNNSPVEQTEAQELIQESEASGTDFLREYGPPESQDIYKEITVQALPDLDTERPFAIIETRIPSESSEAEDRSVEKEENAATNDTTTENTVLSEDDSINEIKEAVPSEDKLNDEISSTEALVVEVVTDVTTVKVDVVSEEVTTPSAISNPEETNTEAKSADQTETTERGSLEYLPPSGIEGEADESNLSKVKSILASQEEESNLYLPPAVDGTEEKVENAIPLSQAALEATQVNVGANLEYLPPAENSVTENLSNDAVNNEIINKESSEESKTADAEQKEATPESVEEGSGSDSVNKEQEPFGFREYGPPKTEDEKKPEVERIENNETRRRRFSTKFVRKH